MSSQSICRCSLLLLLVLLGSHEVFTSSETERLYTHLFDNYQKVTPFANGYGDQVAQVSAELLFYSILSFDAQTEILTTVGQIRLRWVDEHFMWDEDEFNVTTLVVPAGDIWVPDVTIRNSVTEFVSETWDDKFKVRIMYDGRVLWTPGGRFDTVCEMDPYSFPFDVQLCVIQLGPVVSDEYTLKLSPARGHLSINFQYFISNGEWQVVGNRTSVVLQEFWDDQEDGGYSSWVDVWFGFAVQRNSEGHILSIIIPCFLLSFISALVFLLPVDAGEKISFVLTVLLSFTVFLMIMSEKLPQKTKRKPLIAVYLNFIMILNAVALVCTVFVLNQHYKRPLQPVPRWIRIIFLKYLAVPFGLRKWKLAIPATFPKDPMASETTNLDASDGLIADPDGLAVDGNIKSPHSEEEEEVPEKWTKEWGDVAYIIDRMFFVIYVVVALIGTMAFIWVPIQNEGERWAKYWKILEGPRGLPVPVGEDDYELDPGSATDPDYY